VCSLSLFIRFDDHIYASVLDQIVVCHHLSFCGLVNMVYTIGYQSSESPIKIQCLSFTSKSSTHAVLTKHAIWTTVLAPAQSDLTATKDIQKYKCLVVDWPARPGPDDDCVNTTSAVELIHTACGSVNASGRMEAHDKRFRKSPLLYVVGRDYARPILTQRASF
jgi:hypothetical protein